MTIPARFGRTRIARRMRATGHTGYIAVLTASSRAAGIAPDESAACGEPRQVRRTPALMTSNGYDAGAAERDGIDISARVPTPYLA